MVDSSLNLHEIEKKFYETFCYKNFVGPGAISHDLDFCVQNLTAYCQITSCSNDRIPANKIDWIAHVILMRDSLMSHRDMKMLSEQERDRKRRTLNIVSDKVSNYIINRFLFLHQIPIDAHGNNVSYLDRLISHANFTQIQRLNYAVWVKAEYRIVLKPLPPDISEEDLVIPWNIRLEASKLADFASNMLVTTARQGRGPATSHARAEHSSSSLPKVPKVPRESGASSSAGPPSYHPQYTSTQKVHATANYMSKLDRLESSQKYPGMENFIIEQLAIYCQTRQANTQGDPTDWMLLLPFMREYCSHTPTFYEPDLKKRYRVHNLFVDNVAHFVINKYVQLYKLGFRHVPGNEDTIEEDGYESYVNKLVKNSRLEVIQDLNYVLFIKDDSRYPIKPIPPNTTAQQIIDAWDCRLSMVLRTENNSADGLLMKLPLHLGRRAQILSCDSFTNPIFKAVQEVDDEEEERKDTAEASHQQMVIARQRMGGLSGITTAPGQNNYSSKKAVSYASYMPNAQNVIYQPPQKKRRTTKTVLAAKILQAVAAAHESESSSALTMSLIQAYAKEITDASANDSSDENFSDDDDGADMDRDREGDSGVNRAAFGQQIGAATLGPDVDYTSRYLDHLDVLKST
jgi:hypothetical protein